MPSDKDITKPIERIYKANAENLGLFFWVKAQQAILPTIQIEQAIRGYFKFMDIEDNWDIDCAKSTFAHLQKEYFESRKK